MTGQSKDLFAKDMAQRAPFLYDYSQLTLSESFVSGKQSVCCE